MNTAGLIASVAGGTGSHSGDGGPATSALLSSPQALAADTAGNLYIADTGNNVIRKVNRAGIISTVAGSQTAGFAGDGGPATSAKLNSPWGVAADNAGNLYISDTSNHRVRKVTAAGIVSTVAGTGSAGFGGDGGPATSAQLLFPSGLAFDGAGNLIICDAGNNRLRRMSPSGTIITIAGTGTAGSSGDGGPAASAQLAGPESVALDSAGNLFISDSSNFRIRKMYTTGTITTVAGNGTMFYSGDGGPAVDTGMGPLGLTVDRAGNLYMADFFNSRIRQVNSAGVIGTVAGTGISGYSGDGGAPANAQITLPTCITVDNSGNLYICDTSNNAIRLIQTQKPANPVPAISSGGIAPAGSSVNTIQAGEWISIYGTNLAASTASWDGTFPVSLAGTSVTIDGKPAYLSYVSPSQINVQAPDDVATGSVPVVATTVNGSANGMVTLASAAPSLLLLDGKHVAGLLLRTDGSGAYGGGSYDIVGPSGSSLGYRTVAARAGDTIELFVVGLGPTNSPVPAGKPFAGAASAVDVVSVAINNMNLTPVFAGLSGAGLFQLNLTVPAGLGTGDVPLVVRVAGTESQAGVLLSLQ